LPSRHRLPSIPSIPSVPAEAGLFGNFAASYAVVRRPGFVHRRRRSYPSRRGLCWTAPLCGLLHGRRILALPIPAHDASVHAQVEYPAECMQPLPKRSACSCLPRALTVSALRSCTLISGLNTGPTHPLSTLHEWHCCRSRMTRGQSGWLGLLCWGLTPLPSCRF
jgi:hypothetical protein